MSETKQQLIAALKEKFDYVAGIDASSLSWEEGQIQIDMMVELAECINMLERHKHHHHHKFPGPKPEAAPKPEPEPASEAELVILEIEEPIL